MEDGVPQCVSCLDPFDSDEVVPRVLTCGHSLCERCIPKLVAVGDDGTASACPTCKCLIRTGNVYLYPRNIELLRLLAPAADPRPPPDPAPTALPDFGLWSQELISCWKKWIIPPEFVDVQSISVDSETAARTAEVADGVALVRDMDIRESRMVSLLPLRRAPSVLPGGGFRLSYRGRILDVLDRMEEKGRKELAAMLDAASRQRRGLCRVYGLWVNPLEEEDSMVYLVCERLPWNLSIFSRRGIEMKGWGYRVIGMELCEAVMVLQSQGIVCGCFTVSCFCFDSYGHCLLDMNHVLHVGRELRGRIGSGEHIEGSNSSRTCPFVSPELFLLSLGEKNSSNSDSHVVVGSDVWSLACILLMLMGDASLSKELCKLSPDTHLSIDSYNVWMEKVISALQDSSVGPDFDSLKEIIKSCLSYEPGSRPQVADVWRCIRKLVFRHHTDHIKDTGVPAVMENSVYCLFLFDLTSVSKQTHSVPKCQDKSLLQSSNPLRAVGEDVGLTEIIEKDTSQIQWEEIDRDHISGMWDSLFRSFTLEGHRACVTGLAIGGGFLFSSSNDKTIRAWSLKDFSHSHILTGHEHRITAIVIVESKKLCISADSGGYICAWAIESSSDQKPLKKWFEHDDWRFGSVNSLAVDESRLFSCSGDKSIKVWSLKELTFLQKMEGHDSAVCSLVVANGALYSSSRDGTIRLWWLDDYTPMTVLKNEAQWRSLAALSLSVDDDLLAATYENGYIKMWRDHVPMKVMKIEDGAIFASQMIMKKWLFTGGWDKAIEIQRLLVNECQVDAESFGSIKCDSAITSLLYWQGKLFVGFSNKDIKVYCLEKSQDLHEQTD